MGAREGTGRWHWDGGRRTEGRGVSPAASPPRGAKTWLWAAFGRRSVAGEPADQHEVQVHQIDRPGHQLGADPCHRCYTARHSLQEEGDHVSGKPANWSPQITCSGTSAKNTQAFVPSPKPLNLAVTLAKARVVARDAAARFNGGYPRRGSRNRGRDPQKILSISQQGSQGCARNSAGEPEGFSLQTVVWLEKFWGRGVCGAEGGLVTL